jgi:hypothetical protein
MIPDSEVTRLLDELALLMEAEVPEAESIGRWKAAFDAAVAQAERGPGWSEILVRAQELGSQLQSRITLLDQKRVALEGELRTQDAGSRALKGYGSALRS